MRGRAFKSRNQFLEAAASVVEPSSTLLAESAEVLGARCLVQTAGDPADGYDVLEPPDGLRPSPLARSRVN